MENKFEDDLFQQELIDVISKHISEGDKFTPGTILASLTALYIVIIKITLISKKEGRVLLEKIIDEVFNDDS